MLKVFFVLSLCFLAYTHGVFPVVFKLFPHQLFLDSIIASQAFFVALKDEGYRAKPMNFEHFETGGVAEPGMRDRFVTGPAGDELVLIGGGTFELMSHCPRFGCLAWIMDRCGAIRHVWEVDPEGIWGDQQKVAGFNSSTNVVPTGLHSYDNGDLLVIFQARNTYPFSVGIAMFDKDAELPWKRESFSHHWPSVDDAGLIYVLSHKILDGSLNLAGSRAEIVCDSKKIYEDVTSVFAPDGGLVREISLARALLATDHAGPFDRGPASADSKSRDCDPLHLNDVRLLTAEAMFDNLGGPTDKGGSRLLKIDLGSRRARALVTLSRQGRVLELDLGSGEVLWEYLNTLDIGRYLEAKGKTSDQRYARFATHTASYVAAPNFELNLGTPR